MPKASITYYCQQEVCIEGKNIPRGEVLLTVSLHKDIKEADVARALAAIASGVVRTKKPKDEEKPAEGTG